MKTRTYRVKLGDEIRLVTAPSAAQAVRHVVSKAVEVSVATQADLIELLPKIKVEVAGEEPEPQEQRRAA